MKNYLFLFDIDGTIIDTKGDGKIAIINSIEKTLEIKITEDINLRGGIDRVFFKYFFDSFLFPKDKFELYWENFKKIYIAELKKYLKNDWLIFQKAKETIINLSNISNIGLATGNIQKGAKIKMSKFGIESNFNCGGYGDFVLERKDIVIEAIDSAQKFYRKIFDKKNIYLLGDTEKDIKSALDNGINPVLIDPKNKNRDSAKIWGAKYYGNFINFEKFLSYISDNKAESDKEVIYYS